MKKWIVAAIPMAVIALGGCVYIPDDYANVITTPPPARLVGNWQTFGSQDGLESDQAIGSLIIGVEGNTLDCRQWQRVIAKRGKMMYLKDKWVNVNQELRIMPLKLENDQLYYDRLTLRKIEKPTVECQQMLVKKFHCGDRKAVEKLCITTTETHQER